MVQHKHIQMPNSNTSQLISSISEVLIESFTMQVEGVILKATEHCESPNASQLQKHLC